MTCITCVCSTLRCALRCQPATLIVVPSGINSACMSCVRSTLRRARRCPPAVSIIAPFGRSQHACMRAQHPPVRSSLPTGSQHRPCPPALSSVPSGTRCPPAVTHFILGPPPEHARHAVPCRRGNRAPTPQCRTSAPRRLATSPPSNVGRTE